MKFSNKLLLVRKHKKAPRDVLDELINFETKIDNFLLMKR